MALSERGRVGDSSTLHVSVQAKKDLKNLEKRFSKNRKKPHDAVNNDQEGWSTLVGPKPRKTVKTILNLRPDTHPKQAKISGTDRASA